MPTPVRGAGGGRNAAAEIPEAPVASLVGMGAIGLLGAVWFVLLLRANGPKPFVLWHGAFVLVLVAGIVWYAVERL